MCLVLPVSFLTKTNFKMEVNLISFEENLNKAGIYVIWFEGASLNPNGGRKYYIGLAKKVRDRRMMHLNLLRRNKHFNIKVQNAFNKHGEATMRFALLEICEPILEILSDREIYYIKEFNATNNDYGYNLREGGITNIPNQEVCDRISKAQMGNKYNLGKKRTPEVAAKGWETMRKNGYKPQPWSEERKQKAKENEFHHDEETKEIIAEASRKMWETRERVPVTDEYREIMGEKRRGKKSSPETCAKQSKSLKKVVHTEEWNAKVAAALTGKKQTPEHTENVRRANDGRKHTGDARENMRQAQLKRQERLRQEKLTGIKIENDNPPTQKQNRSPEKSGIYKISFIGADWNFIDSAPKLKYKRNFILKRLRRGENTNKEMQKLYNQYGDASFVFTVLEYCDIEGVEDKVNSYK